MLRWDGDMLIKLELGQTAVDDDFCASNVRGVVAGEEEGSFREFDRLSETLQGDLLLQAGGNRRQLFICESHFSVERS